MNRLDYILASLRRAGENGYAWSVSPDEAGALVAEVDRLRAEVTDLWNVYMDGLLDGSHAIERGEHLKETQMTIERSCYTCRWACGNVCDHPCCSEDMDVGIDRYAFAAGCLKNKGMPLDRTLVCPGHERGEHRREENE